MGCAGWSQTAGMGLPGPGQGVCSGQHWSPQGQRQRAVGLSHLLQLLSDHTSSEPDTLGSAKAA